MKIVVFISALILLFLVFLYKARRGLKKKVSMLERPIKDLLRRGYNGGFLLINIPWSKKFIQLRKYIKEPGDYGIELSFPNAKWAQNQFIKLKEICDDENITYEIVCHEPLDFLFVDFGKDLNYANTFVKRILLLLFDLKETDIVLVSLENSSVHDELIDS